MPSVTVASVTGVDLEGHHRAIYRTSNALPFDCERLLHFVGGMTYDGYNKFMVKSLWKIISTDFVITCQADGYAVHPELWTDYFFEWDYIGAPWPWNNRIGNGGVSLRSKRFMEISSCLPDPELNEDVWICEQHRDYMEQNGLRFAPQEVAAAFCYEQKCPLIEGHSPDKAWAWHGAPIKTYAYP